MKGKCLRVKVWCFKSVWDPETDMGKCPADRDIGKEEEGLWSDWIIVTYSTRDQSPSHITYQMYHWCGDRIRTLVFCQFACFIHLEQCMEKLLTNQCDGCWKGWGLEDCLGQRQTYGGGDKRIWNLTSLFCWLAIWLMTCLFCERGGE